MIIDVHCHLGVWPQFDLPDESLAGVLRLMDRLSIDRAISAHGAWLLGDAETGRAQSRLAHEQSSGRMLAYAVFDPRDPRARERVRRALGERSVFVGIKIHPSLHGCPAEDERYRPAWELAAQEAVPLLTHSWEVSDYNPVQELSFPARFAGFAAEYPQVALILGHAGARPLGHRAAVALAQDHPGVWLDLSGDGYALGQIEFLVEQVGAERILFGTDLNWIDPRTHLGRVLDAGISTADKVKILRGNACRLFGFDSSMQEMRV